MGLSRRAALQLNRRLRGNVEDAIDSISRAEIMVGQVSTKEDAVLQNRTGLGLCKLEHYEMTRCCKIAQA